MASKTLPSLKVDRNKVPKYFHLKVKLLITTNSIELEHNSISSLSMDSTELEHSMVVNLLQYHYGW